MNKRTLSIITTAVALAFSAGAMAASMSKAEYKTSKATIVSDYKAASTACGAFAANAKDVCMAEAKGKENVAKAELEAGYKPGNKATYNVSIARADADYAVAKEKCDDKGGNDKAVCLKEAKSANVAAAADAKAQMKSTNAKQSANEKSSDARQTAATDKRNAEYAVAREKCDKFADDVKATCVREAKTRYGQS